VNILCQTQKNPRDFSDNNNNNMTAFPAP